MGSYPSLALVTACAAFLLFYVPYQLLCPDVRKTKCTTAIAFAFTCSSILGCWIAFQAMPRMPSYVMAGAAQS